MFYFWNYNNYFIKTKATILKKYKLYYNYKLSILTFNVIILRHKQIILALQRSNLAHPQSGDQLFFYKFESWTIKLYQELIRYLKDYVDELERNKYIIHALKYLYILIV